MIIRKRITLYILSALLLLNLFFTVLNAQAVDSLKGLKEYYKGFFPIGVAVSTRNIANASDRDFIVRNFNSVTPENAMKMGPIHPEEGRFNWSGADSIVNFAYKNHIRVRGHNLCWHNQVPKWIFYDKQGKLVSKEILLARLKDHISAVVKRYKGKIYAWDVVNEAVSDDPDEFLRNSLWYRICGEEFIFKAFSYAHDADPDAQLFYNDYNTERPDKRDKVFRLLKKLLDAGIPVTGVGLQAHWSLTEPNRNELEETIKLFSSLGIKVQITELDISVYPWEKNTRGKRLGEIDSYTPEKAAKQSAQYKMVFDVFRQFKGTVNGVTFWNLTDKDTWLDNFPVRGRKNHPLLFDENYRPKDAFWQVTRF